MVPFSHLRFASVALCATASTGVGAAELSAACQPLYSAMEKTIQIDHNTASTNGATTIKGVTIGGVMYVQSRGAWVKSPLTPADTLKRSRENLKNAKEYSCKSLGDSTVEGVPVANWSTHTVSEDTTVDSKVAIAKDTGLVVQVENAIADKSSSYVTRYTYTGVKAPM